MTATRCVVCRRDSHQGHACAVCEQRMRDQLRDVLEFYALATGELVPGSTSGARGTERSIGVRVSALDYLAGHDAVAVLASWESEWREHYGLSVEPMIARPAPMLSRCVAFLGAWLHRACADHPAVDEFARELEACWGEGRSAARMAPPQRVAISCPADDDTREDGICGARIPVDREQVHGHVQCRRCRTGWQVPHLIHVALTTPGVELWADPEAAAGYFCLDESTLRKWARAGRIRRDHGRYELTSIQSAITGVSNAG
jgi:hypothetical protein